MSVLLPFVGIALLVAFLFLLSESRSNIKWRTVAVGMALQTTIALFVLKVPIGQKILQAITNGVQTIISFGNDGLGFVFGDLAKSTGSAGMVFGIQVLGQIIFFSALTSILYYTGIMNKVVSFIGGIIGKLMGTTRAESFSATMNTVLGVSDTPVMIKPFINKLTRSELFAVLVGGTASMAGSILVGYTLLGIPLQFLLLACFMVAPAGLVVAKMLIPETEESQTNEPLKLDRKLGSANIFDAIASGTQQGVQIAISVGGMLIAFVSIIALINGGLGFFNTDLSTVLGYIVYPFAYLLGIDAANIMPVASAIGTKFAVNEFVAFAQIGEVMSTFDVRTQAITTIALGGFANFSVIGILLGGFSVISPERRPLVAELGFKAILGGLICNLISAAIVSIILFF